MKHLPLRECGYAIGVVAFLVALYVGSYYALVEKKEAFAVSSWALGNWPSYRVGGAWAEKLYDPMYHLDRRLRPHIWNAPDLPDVGSLRRNTQP
jgi:hypothetical protein